MVTTITKIKLLSSQQKYICHLLEKTKIKGGKDFSTPLLTSKSPTLEEETSFINTTPYQ